MGEEHELGLAGKAWRTLKRTASLGSRRSTDYESARSGSPGRHSSSGLGSPKHSHANGSAGEFAVAHTIPENGSVRAGKGDSARQQWLDAFDAATLRVMAGDGGAAQSAAEAQLPEVAPWNRQPGYLGHLTRSQEAALQQLRGLFPDSRRWHTDHDLLRFLRARDFDVPQAREMYAKYVREYRGGLMVSPHPVVRPIQGHEGAAAIALFPERGEALSACLRKLVAWFLHTTVFGSDRDGRPVVYFRPADIIRQGMAKHVPCADRIAFQSAANEATQVLLKLASKQAGYHIDSITQVLDLGGMSALQMVGHMRSADAQREWQHNMDFMPEILHKIFVINAPTGMGMVWRMASYFLPAATKRKIVVCGSGYKGELQAAIGRERMPSCYGGALPFDWPPHRPVKELQY